jgi:segregation and condensation protein A
MSAPVTHTRAARAGEGKPTPGGSRYAVKLPAFEGPLDLLLHLIRLNEVEITDIPIAQIGEQYLEYLDLMRELNLDVAGEYLLMAATLAWIKSRMLLPPDPSQDEDESLDPRAELMACLFEYQRFREAAVDLGARPLLGRDVYPACGSEPEQLSEAEREIEVGIFQLVEAFRQALRHAGPSGVAHEVEAETVTVRDRMIAVMELLTHREACDFEGFVTEDGAWASRAVVVATFLAILELTRLAAIGLYQGLSDKGIPEGPIHVRRISEAGDRGWAERISEFM